MKLWLVPVLLGVLTLPCRADLEPISIPGEGISPVGQTPIRMFDAKVDITWGSPPRLSAVFAMDNPSGKDVPTLVSFPVYVSAKAVKSDALHFSMAFNGKPFDKSSITHPPRDASDWSELTSFECKYTFPPGKTTVTVSTDQPALAAHGGPFQQTLRYCIRTGGKWAGTIGHESVAIHFPITIQSEMITAAEPGGAKIDGQTIQWDFTDFKPKGNDHDIFLQYYRPEALATIAVLRKQHDDNPRNTIAALQLAKHLFELIPDDQFSVSMPLSKTEYSQICESNLNATDLAFLKQSYSPYGPNNDILERTGTDSKRLAHILNNCSFQPDKRVAFVDQARNVMEALLKMDPTYADAWNVYVANDYKVCFVEGSSPWENSDAMLRIPFPDEILLKRAQVACPDDPTLKMWDVAMKSGLGQPNADLESQVRSRCFSNLVFPKIDVNAGL